MKFKTRPYEHQLRTWERTRDLETYAVFWEMGTGKTKLAIDTAAWLRERGEIDALLVVAPNGVHTNWITDEIPTHLPGEPVQAHAWSTRSASTKWHQWEVEKMLEPTQFAVLAMSYDAIMTRAGWSYAQKFAEKRDALLVLDESQRIKTPSAKRTKRLVAFGKRFQYKRILSGTPVTNSPFDVWTQLRFLDGTFWDRAGFASLESFKTTFAVFQERVNSLTGARFNELMYYKNLPLLAEKIRPISSRVTKEDVLDLPPKVYSKRYFQLSPEQGKLYRQLRDEFMTELASGEIVTAALIVTRILRLQQITCAYLTSDDCETTSRLEKNPRLALLLDTLQDLDGQAIIFARFQEDVRWIAEELARKKHDHVVYHGPTSEKDRLRAVQKFKGGKTQFFVGNPAACGTGLTLLCPTVLYYSNSFNLEQRLQSEDRAHRIGASKTVHYVDLVAEGTVDAKIVASLRDKRNLAATITGDEVKEWL